MADAHSDSDLSSDLSSVPPSPTSLDAPSSPLSVLSSSPEPPDYFDFAMAPRSRPPVPYPSPPASQQTSEHGTPTPDGMESNTEDGRRPAKRRRISKDPKERTTEYLNLRAGKLSYEQQDNLDLVMNVLHKRQKIVVIAGAGMSKSAGVPDFRSKEGLFCSLKKEHNLKGSGQHLFDASVYKDDASTTQFHSMISQMARLTKDAKPTPFHHMLATIAQDGRLMRLYSQNVDGLETNMEPLRTRTPLTKDESGKWPRSVQLHGGLDKMVCTKCHDVSDMDAALFAGSEAPLCAKCDEVNNIRTTFEGKRSHGVGRLRPRMVLYHESGPDEAAIGAVSVEDLRRRPDAVVVVGTTLKVKGLQRLVKEMCGVVRNRKDGGLAIWINPDPPPAAGGFRDCFDIIVQGTCDEVAEKAAMRRWNEPVVVDDFSEVSEEDVAKAAAKRAQVVLSSCGPKEAIPIAPPTAEHINNSFKPPLVISTPRHTERSPDCWSPLSSRRSSVLSSIENVIADGENIMVSESLRLPTPDESDRSTPSKKAPTAFEKLNKSSQTKSAPKSAKIATMAKKIAASNLKGTKPTKSTKTTSKAKCKPQQPSKKSNAITNVFGQSKAAATVAKNNVVKKGSLPSPAKSPSKLRQVSNASGGEPMTPVKAKDARVNTSPVKTPLFPGLKRKSVEA
ncbi:hypothetical protein LTR78_008997 [Recurvomyces mirabilis]|uniref:Deacetylase sirtuin-type domain-containing protein n=1 Tax=Recurvomyces mirabilis TaxID=574656 RepID=A0AAE0WFJ6_9PEZI|nr:hypothetical protein LTR78_008997 [Recurvomyces mirabilis]KAK5159797.1 hypothetical protein LTS14_001902 [Recurvomyces mirabilis]